MLPTRTQQSRCNNSQTLSVPKGLEAPLCQSLPLLWGGFVVEASTG